MREALGSIVDHAYDRWDINRIQATGDLDNHASMGLLRSLGFIEEGIMRQWGYWKDAFQTFVPYNCYLAIPNLKAQFDTSA
jgi:[ribosomal protein S5]-alanine N-acetyltransferase